MVREESSPPPFDGSPIILSRIRAAYHERVTGFVRTWGGPVAVTLIAGVIRFVGLGTPSTLVFDETYYVKDAYSMLNLGYEGAWPEGADARFTSDSVDIFTSAPAYIAHPPLGKWIIGLGLQIFGAEDPFGWRVSTALLGTLAVALLCVIAYALFRSPTLATLAGFFLAIDGLAITMSRTALLDNSLMFVTLLGFGAVLLDRRQSAERLAGWMLQREKRGLSVDWGPALWWRPWLVTAGLLFGLATGIKWSGIYFLAVFAVYTLFVDACARRRAGVSFWATSVLLKQAPVSFLLTVPIGALAYLSTWAGWLVTRGGYDREWAENRVAAGGDDIVPGIPLALQSLWHYHQAIYGTNLGLATPHPYQANPLGWLAMIRPTAFYYRGTSEGELGCSIQSCSEYVTSVANPLLWYLAVAAAVYLVYRLIRRREWRVGLILIGVAAGYLPWLLYTERTVFQFYTIVFLPYLILGFVFVLGLMLAPESGDAHRRAVGVRFVIVLVGAITIVSVFFYSAWTGLQVSGLYQQLHYWLPSWR